MNWETEAKKHSNPVEVGLGKKVEENNPERWPVTIQSSGSQRRGEGEEERKTLLSSYK